MEPLGWSLAACLVRWLLSGPANAWSQALGLWEGQWVQKPEKEGGPGGGGQAASGGCAGNGGRGVVARQKA